MSKHRAAKTTTATTTTTADQTTTTAPGTAATGETKETKDTATTETAPAPKETATTETATKEATKVETETPTTEHVTPAYDPRVFTLTGVEFKVGKGFATELHATLKALGSATAKQAADAMLASGAYQRVAPQAAAKRPVKPCETLFKQWLAQGVVTAS